MSDSRCHYDVMNAGALLVRALLRDPLLSLLINLPPQERSAAFSGVLSELTSQGIAMLGVDETARLCAVAVDAARATPPEIETAAARFRASIDALTAGPARKEVH